MLDAAADTDARVLRALMLALGGVATGAGLHSALTGGRSLPGGGPAELRADSELRYYGAFYAAFGLAALEASRQPRPQSSKVRSLAGVLFAGGLARANGWRTRGRPHPVQVALLAAELGVPPVLVALA
jgi:hypothetical protein